MDLSETSPRVDPDRVDQLVETAVAGRPLSPEATASLERAIARLPEAIAESEAEARAEQR